MDEFIWAAGKMANPIALHAIEFRFKSGAAYLKTEVS